MNINGVEVFNITDGVYTYFKERMTRTKKLDLTVEDVRKELTRDVLAGRLIGETKTPGRFLYYYGDLAIIVKDNEVVWVRSALGTKQFEVNWKVKRELDRKLGLYKEPVRSGIITKGFAVDPFNRSIIK